jgi:hypothetical protein
MADHAWPGAPLRWQAAHGPAPRSDGRPPMARRGRAMLTGFAAARMPASTGRATGQHPHATGQHSQATHRRSRQLTTTRRQHTGTRGNRPALAATGQRSRQPGSTRGNRARFVRFGARVRWLRFLACAQAVLGLTAVARQPAGPPRRLQLEPLPTLGGDPDGGSGRIRDAGIPSARTPEGGRPG